LIKEKREVRSKREKRKAFRLNSSLLTPHFLMNLYAYCLSDEVTPDALDEITGIEDRPARLICYESIKAVVSDMNSERVAVTRENVLAHDSVIRQVLRSQTPLPFRFGMVASTSQLADYIASQRTGLLSQLARVRDSVEMSVKVIWDAQTVKRAASERAADSRAADSLAANKAEASGPGAGFLRAKQDEIIRDEALKAQAERIRDWLCEALGESVRETVARTLPSEVMVLAASHLVERARLRDYRARLAQAKEARSDLRFLTSGAWPPYSFCNLDS